MYKILGTDNKEYGPVSAEQLRQWILQGRANRNTLVQAEGASSWKPLSLFPEFSATLGSVPAAQPAPATVQVVSNGTNGMAVASLVSGIVSLPGAVCCCLPTLLTAPLGIVFGIIALVQVKSCPQQSGRGMAWTGIALSIVALALTVLLMFLGVFAEQIEKWLK
jgi:hypothetical protein